MRPQTETGNMDTSKHLSNKTARLIKRLNCYTFRKCPAGLCTQTAPTVMGNEQNLKQTEETELKKKMHVDSAP